MNMSYPGGYFAELRKKYSYKKISKYIKITANTSWISNGSCDSVQYRSIPQCLIQGDELQMYHSEENKVAKIVFDMNTPFVLTGFALKAIKSGCCWLKSYSLEGSNDNENWNQITYNSNDDLSGNNDNWHYYPVNISKYRYFGIFQDPDPLKASCGGYYFALHTVDFTGFAPFLFNRGNTCKQRSTVFKLNIFALIILNK